jgi:hypothetical protein
MHDTVPIPEIHDDDAKTRLWEVATTMEKMQLSLRVAVETLFCGEPDLRPDMIA